MTVMKTSVLFVACQLLAVTFAHDELQSCNDVNGDSRYCTPARSARNVVAGRPPTVTSTCGLAKSDQVCLRAGAVGDYAGPCKNCSSSEFSPEFITDAEEADTVTYWQSQTYSVVQYPNSVNVTFALGKAYAVEDIKIVFQSSRPESFALLASTDYGDTFRPIHYFSRSCLDTYGISEGAGGSETPGCSSDAAQLLPLTGGTASFSATERIGSAVIATDIRIRLDRLNTFGDERTLEEEVLDSYYYAISDVAISGACFCNGHASSCSEDDSGQWRCDCAHNTAGRDCDVCLPLFNDLPWRPSTQEEAAECKQCNCNGRASRCSFSEEAFADSGSVSGGMCECLFNTSGKNCEICIDGKHLPCSPCGCSGEESNDYMCDQVSGQCRLSVCPSGFHRVKDRCPACPKCYDDVLLEYQSAVSLLEELGRTINNSLNGSLVDNSLLLVVEDLRQLLNNLATRVSDLFKREMELKSKIQNVTSDTAASETAINTFRFQVVGYENNSRIAAQQITHSRTNTSEVRELVEEIDINLMQYALGNLTAAEQLFSQIKGQLLILIDIANNSEQASLEQEQRVDQLLQKSLEALNGSINAYSKMCSVLKKENETLSDLDSLVKNNITDLDRLHNETQEELSQAITRANTSLNDSERLGNVVDNLSIPDYDPIALIMESNRIHSASVLVINESMSLHSSIEIYRQNFTKLNLTAHELLDMAVTLNDTAMDLTMRAHAARANANSSVLSAEEVIKEIGSLLLELNERLEELKDLAFIIEKLKKMLEVAENVSFEAESEAVHQEELLQEAFQTAKSTTEILSNVAIDIQFAAETATAALENANTSSVNTQTLKDDIKELSSSTSESNQTVDLLKERADQDSDAIAMTKVVADYAESNVSATQRHIMKVKSTLDAISEELNSLELIPEEKFADFMMQLSSVSDTLDATDIVLNSAQTNLTKLEEQFAILQERYTTLLQHRDLLWDIYDQIEDLDCETKFLDM